MARDAFQRNRQERLAREGPQRPLSERHDELMRDGQEIAQALARQLPASTRTRLEAPPDESQSDRDFVRDRCQALLEANTQALGNRGEAHGATSQAFLAECRNIPAETFRCADQGQAGRENPDCRQHLAVLDRHVRTLRADARQVARPEQRIDTLVDQPWDSERESVAPEQLAPEAMD